ncbi:hypothetical protein OPQ81_002079 [Rhizoctonia solani]|nr:hypothetical protein OPQ81_002079 [Rhizoctonia solani]
MTSTPHAPSPTTHPVRSFTNPTASLMDTKFSSEPSAATLNLSALAYLLGVTVITWCTTRATEKYSLWTRDAWTSMPWARICLLLVLLDSWLYLIMTGVLLHGAPPEHEPHRCTVAITMCLTYYCVSKILVYLCLIERVRAIWVTNGQRLRSPIYLFCLSSLIPLVGMLVGVMIPQAIHYIRNGYCFIGINRLCSAFLLAYDIFINLFLTGVFIIPLARSTIRSAWLRTVAIRSTVASLIALLTTSANVVILYLLEGNETIWVCFGSCAADVVINALSLYWAMQGPGEGSTPRVKSAYFSPIGNIPTIQPGTSSSITIDQHRSTASRILSMRENASDTTVAASCVRAPSLEKPRPTMQNPQAARLRCRVSIKKAACHLPLASEMHLSFKGGKWRIYA